MRMKTAGNLGVEDCDGPTCITALSVLLLDLRDTDETGRRSVVFLRSE